MAVDLARDMHCLAPLLLALLVAAAVLAAAVKPMA
jgi:hypothetical protein